MDPFEKLRQLTAREREVLSLYAQGIKYEDIGKQLNVTENTVRAHVSHIYEKLQLYHLPRRARLVAIVQDYAPLLDQLDDSESESTKDLEIITPPTPEQEETIDEDAKAIRALQVVEQPEPPKRGPGCLARIGGFVRTVLILLLLLSLAAVGGAAAIGWDETQDILTDLFPQFFVAATTPEPTDPPDDPLPSPVVVTATDVPTTSTLEPTDTPTQGPTATLAPTLTQTPRPSPTFDFGPIYEVGEWHQEGEIWLRLLDYELYQHGGQNILYFTFEIWNQGDEDIFFYWSTYQNTFLRDNTGHGYELTIKYAIGDDNEVIQAGSKELLLPGVANSTAGYDVEEMFQPNVTELYFTVEYLSRIERATWVVYINK